MNRLKMNPRHQTALLIWLAIYPLITLLFYFFGDYLAPLPLALRTFVLTIVAVPLVFYIIVPFYQKAINRKL